MMIRAGAVGRPKADVKFSSVADAMKVIRRLSENNLHYDRRLSYNFSLTQMGDKPGDQDLKADLSKAGDKDLKPDLSTNQATSPPPVPVSAPMPVPNPVKKTIDLRSVAKTKESSSSMAVDPLAQPSPRNHEELGAATSYPSSQPEAPKEANVEKGMVGYTLQLVSGAESVSSSSSTSHLRHHDR